MRLLLDTHCFLWWLEEPERLAPAAYAAIKDGRNVIHVSAGSAWEIAIKHALGKLRLPAPPQEYVPSRLAEEAMTGLAIETRHALHAGALPMLHHDPFDRLLVAQAQLEGLVLVTADSRVAIYDVEILWAGVDPPPSRLRHPSA